MDKSGATKIVQTDLHEHPANLAWRQLSAGRSMPERIELLKGLEPKRTKRGVRFVCRLVGAGPAGSSIIAKWSLRSEAEVERVIYAEILPHLPVTSLNYFGTVEEASGEFCWTFLEDAGGERYSAKLSEHRNLVAEWLGMMHASSTQIAAASFLPRKGTNYYLRRLRFAREAIQSHIAGHSLRTDDLLTLETIVRQCDLLESNWEDVKSLCAGMPTTLIHGDIAPRNLRVRRGRPRSMVFPFDWAEAGWGVPATDVGFAEPTNYISAVRAYWPRLDIQVLAQVALAGKIFRFLDSIYWELSSLKYLWWSTPMHNMRVYERRIADAISAAGFRK